MERQTVAPNIIIPAENIRGPRNTHEASDTFSNPNMCMIVRYLCCVCAVADIVALARQ